MNISAKWMSGLILNISVIAEILFFIFSKNNREDKTNSTVSFLRDWSNNKMAYVSDIS